jgi:DNA-binding XRE family transcriptional regulator
MLYLCRNLSAMSLHELRKNKLLKPIKKRIYELINSDISANEIKNIVSDEFLVSHGFINKYFSFTAMKQEIMNKRIKKFGAKYPENLKIKRSLRPGDQIKLAKRMGITRQSISQVLNGERRISNSLAKEIVKLINERKAIEAELKQALTQKS